MFWLLKKIFGIGVAIAILFFALHLEIGGRQVKDYVTDFYHAPIVQAALKQGKDTVMSYLRKDVSSGEEAAPSDQVNDAESKELEDVLKKESH